MKMAINSNPTAGNVATRVASRTVNQKPYGDSRILTLLIGAGSYERNSKPRLVISVKRRVDRNYHRTFLLEAGFYHSDNKLPQRRHRIAHRSYLA
jgi:hypothetical protein